MIFMASPSSEFPTEDGGDGGGVGGGVDGGGLTESFLFPFESLVAWGAAARSLFLSFGF